MAPTVVGSLTGGVSNSGTTVTVPVDAGLLDGDYRLVFLDTAGSATIATPSGWTLVGSAVVASTRSIYCFSDIHSSGSPAATSFTISTAQNYGAVWMAARGYSPAGTVDVGPTAGSGTTGTAVDAPTVTTTVPDTLLVTCHVVFTNSSTVTLSTPTGMSLVGGQNGNGTIGHLIKVFAEARPGAGSTGARSSTSSLSTNWGAMSVAVRPWVTSRFLPFFP